MPDVDEFGRVINPDTRSDWEKALAGAQANQPQQQGPPDPNAGQYAANQAQQLFSLQRLFPGYGQPQAPQTYMSPRTTTLKEDVAGWAAGGVNADPVRRWMADKVFGGTGTGEPGTGIVDFTPFGRLFAAHETGQKIGELGNKGSVTAGDLGDIALTGTGMLGGKLPGATKIGAAGEQGIFAGQRSKTADLGALAEAKKLWGSGVDNERIFNQTGWFQGADGLWRYEISDAGSVFNPPGRIQQAGQKYLGQRQPLGDVLTHPELQSAYPGIERISSSTLVTDPMARAQYGHPAQFPQELINYRLSHPDPNLNALIDPHSSVLHEVQHAVQAREGFAPGAHPSNMDIIPNTPTSPGSPAFNILVERSVAEGRPPRDAAELAAWAKDAKEETYRRVAGEVEARNVQNRQNYSPELRRQVFPDYTAYRFGKDQIVNPPLPQVMTPDRAAFPMSSRVTKAMIDAAMNRDR